MKREIENLLHLLLCDFGFFFSVSFCHFHFTFIPFGFEFGFEFTFVFVNVVSMLSSVYPRAMSRNQPKIDVIRVLQHFVCCCGFISIFELIFGITDNLYVTNNY